MSSVLDEREFCGGVGGVGAAAQYGVAACGGVFTTMRAEGGRVWGLERHLARLRRSCEILFVPLQYKDESAGGRWESCWRGIS